jgi:hypothetical protein
VTRYMRGCWAAKRYPPKGQWVIEAPGYPHCSGKVRVMGGCSFPGSHLGLRGRAFLHTATV